MSELSCAGEINWNTHIASSAHFENVKKAAATPSKMLHSFFNKKATSLPLEAPRRLSTLAPFRLSSSLTPGVSPSLPIAQQDDEAWENLDSLLNQVIGYVATPETISQRIRQGKFGVDGMHT